MVNKVHRALRSRAALALVAVCAAAAASGCSFMTPSLSEYESRSATPAVSAPTVMEDGVLTVAVNSNDAPFAMMDTDGSATGYAIDLSAALADEMGLDVRFVDAASATALDEGTADVYVAALSADASDTVDVVGTVAYNGVAVYGKGGMDSAALPTDMAGARVAVQDQSASQDVLTRSGISAEQVTFSNVNDCFEALDAGEVDYVVCESIAGSYLARSYDGVGFEGILGDAENYGVAVASDNLDLSEAVTEALDSITADGTLSAVWARWFGGNPFDLTDQQIPGVTIAESVSEDGASEDDASADAGASGADGAEDADEAAAGGESEAA